MALEDNMFDFVREEKQFEKILTNLIHYAAPPPLMGEDACNIADII
jgi:hypothetical protein